MLGKSDGPWRRPLVEISHLPAPFLLASKIPPSAGLAAFAGRSSKPGPSLSTDFQPPLLSGTAPYPAGEGGSCAELGSREMPARAWRVLGSLGVRVRDQPPPQGPRPSGVSRPRATPRPPGGHLSGRGGRRAAAATDLRCRPQQRPRRICGSWRSLRSGPPGCPLLGSLGLGPRPPRRYPSTVAPPPSGYIACPGPRRRAPPPPAAPPPRPGEGGRRGRRDHLVPARGMGEGGAGGGTSRGALSPQPPAQSVFPHQPP